jgi:16S rRNA pseudouridine516 synthase
MKTGKTIRLERLLANLGYGSRKEVARMVKRGLVTLGDAVLKDPAEPVSLAAAERVSIEGIPVDPLSPLLILLHKPAGYVCSHNEPGGGADVFDLLPPRFRLRDPAIAIAGRLDKESTGLLLLTDDGQFLHRITSPKTHVPKVYQAVLDRPLRGDEPGIFASGTLMLKSETKPLKPAQLTVIDDRTAQIILHEGRYHQVRRMFAAVGNHVLALHRQSVGGLDLGELPEGEWRFLSEEDRAKILGTDNR